MDGLSAAASGIAVVSLALQLVGSVRDIRRFLHNMSEAPEELKRLIDLLEQLEVILEHVGLLVHRQRGNGRLEETGLMTSLTRAIVTCEKKLALLEGVVETTKKASASSRVAKTLGSFKLACHKKDIRSFEQQLGEAVNLLSLTMMANLTFVHSEGIKQLHSQVSATNQTTNFISQELILLRNDLSNKREAANDKTNLIARSCKNKRGMSPTSKFSRKQHTACQSYASIFGKLTIKRVSKPSGFHWNEYPTDPGTYSTTTTSWNFMPSFLSRGFEYQSFNSFGSIQRAIRIYPVIPDFHPIWHMCLNGDLKGVQALLSTQQISPFSVNKHGSTLLHYAALRFQPEVCELLFQQGLSGQEVTVSGRQPWMDAALNGEILRARDTYVLFRSRCEDFDKQHFLRRLFLNDHLKVSLETFSEITESLCKDTINEFEVSPLVVAMRMWHGSKNHHRDDWGKFVHRLLALEPDLHKPYGSSQPSTILYQILSIAEFPCESGDLGEGWLTILEGSGINLEQYLRSEGLTCDNSSLPIFDRQRNWDLRRAHDRYAYIIFSKSSPRVSWDWYINPESPAVEVLHEFKNLGPSSYDILEDYLYPQRMGNWPYFCPRWGMYHSHLFRHVMTVDEVKHSRTLFENRSERRRLKKARKLYKAQGIGKHKRIPGAWID